MPTTSAEAPWSFANAKAVDIVWDLLIGRGMQVTFVWMAFRSFSKALLRIMDNEEIPFSTYSAVGFTTGSFSSFFSLLGALKNPAREHAQEYADDAPAPGRRSNRARVAIVTMATVTLYTGAVPSFFSAMSGYYSPSYPSLFYFPSGTSPSNMFTGVARDEFACSTDPKGITPAWGYILDALRSHNSPDYQVFSYPPEAWLVDCKCDSQLFRLDI
jgi:hypothetical protein